MEPTILYQDEDILVINKPAGMIVNKADTTKDVVTVQEWAEDKFKVKSLKLKVEEGNDFINRGGIVHRLDKETSGALIIAKTQEAFIELQRQFKERLVQKTYTALVYGNVKTEAGDINVPIGRLPWNRMRFGVLVGGRESYTTYKVVEKYRKDKNIYTRLELHPLTGRTHQIRVHVKHLGFPIVGDILYGGRKQTAQARKWCPRLFLHAQKISFLLPGTNQNVTFEAPLPQDLQETLAQLTHFDIQ